ncbi:MAG: CPBP family intramembrane metalloprotease [Candidatus Lokiarchaeota archaeon]|nr:CPBP family intramembrane metalloprotease [Candidatus Lokiarchaeota archaeon]
MILQLSGDISQDKSSNQHHQNIQERSPKKEYQNTSLLSRGTLWGLLPSLIIPIVALIAMLLSSELIIAFILLTTANWSLVLDLASNPLFLSLLSLLEYIFLLIPIVHVGKYLREPTIKNRLKILGYTLEEPKEFNLAKEALIGLLLALFAVFMVTIISILMELIFSSVEISVDDPLLDLNAYELILWIFIMFLVIAPSEEVLFRGFMQKGFVRSRLGNALGIVFSALIFAFIHLLATILDFALSGISLDVFIATFASLFVPYLALSLLLGLVFQWRNENLYTVTIMHGTYNSLLLLLGFLFF